MEIIGDDKRIRALFSETRFADEQGAPSFTATWNRAQAHALRPRRAFNLSFAVATALLVVVLGGLALWSKNQPAPTVHTAFANLAAGEIKPKTGNGGQQVVTSVDQVTNHQQIKIRRALTAQRNALTLAAAIRKSEKKAEAEAKQLASWQSPTASLLSSSSDSLFKSLPQLNENSTELKSFLPNRDNEKEK